MKRIVLCFVLWGVATALGCLWIRFVLGVMTPGMALAIACAVLVAMPPSLDPAIQIKERQRRKP